MEDVKPLLEEASASFELSDSALQQTRARAKRRSARQRLAGGTAALAAVAVTSYMLVALVPSAHHPTAPTSKATTPSLPLAEIQSGRLIYKCGNGLCERLPLTSRQVAKLADRNAYARWNPVWSPAGSQIAYRGYYGMQDGAYDLYVANEDGSDATRLTFGLNGEDPSWSPDGTQIAFDTSGNGSLYTIAPDGSGLQKLTSGESSGYADTEPTWSPDGSQIAFVRYPAAHAFGEGYGSVEILDVGSGQVHDVLGAAGGVGYANPAWSPNGRALAATIYSTASPRTRIGYLDLKSGDPRPLVPFSAIGAWNPMFVDDQTILFLSRTRGMTGLYATSLANPEAATLILPLVTPEFDWHSDS